MINFYDLLQKPQGLRADPPSTSVRVASEDIVPDFDLRRVPVEQVDIKPESRIVVHSDPQGAGADRFRFLRMRLRELWDTGKLRKLLVTSPLPEDGKSTIALNLATVLAERGKRTVLLVEADLHHSTLTERLGIEKRPGLAECLESDLHSLSALRRLEPLGWYFLAAGEAHGNPTELMQSEALARMIRTLSPHFDWIVIDSPPVAPLTDAVSLTSVTDASLLIVRAGHTPREAVETAIARLGSKHVLGIVLNGVEGLNRLYSKYYGYYGKK